MPEKQTLRRAAQDRRAGKSASTQAGEFVRQEMHHIREGKHGAKNTKQAIAIGLSEARRAGVDIPDKRGERPSRATKRRSASKRSSPKRARASLNALKRQPRSAASHRALSRQAHSAAKQRPARARSASARKAARTRARSAR